ncbi:hypothetical protein BEWA_027130 [Theileria equi strain WA]|uniref:Holocytochrome c-type synthase n=1 Tax=Theileria equi strain WA TaxID=1537102 RepID=L0AY85_THEEQ|nr:hypothetical protein BEWA_027130 [Theileria equi strain WA]AFZ79864.1 hypothetical protein BEWA_027130 [Theileria equi strain WA]|eukprot:XP_004829530.1 hypothetical protein BEWA_027130 [Theileria equi strain WA]
MDRILGIFRKKKQPLEEPEGSHPDATFCPMLTNSDNQMPYLPNKPIGKAGISLETDRKTSSIPRAGYDENWVYPSPMQFYNALVLKNKSNGDANYMKEAVHAHNEVNEQSWQKVLEWEVMHKKTCPKPELRRFVGRYNAANPKSIFKRLFTRLAILAHPHLRLIPLSDIPPIKNLQIRKALR